MAIGRLSVCTGAKGKASAHAQYIAREGKYAKDPTIEKLEHTEVGNMPKWAESDPNFFWQMSDEYERKNGSTYREHVITLPRELNESQRLALIHDWIKQEIGDKFAYQFAIHNPKAMDGKEQPHCHLMFSERTIDGIERDPEQYFKRYNSKNPERGGARKANTGIPPAERKAELSEQRDRWEKMCNSHLELANRKARITMKSLKDRGYKRQPINLTMAQIQTPEIRAVYMADLTAKRSYTAVAKERNQIDIPIERELQERQKRLADLAKIREAAQQKTAQAPEKAAQERLEQQAAEKAAQERLEQEAAEKAAQERLEQEAAEKAAQERLEQQAAEKAAQERLEQQAAEKAEQGAIKKRTPFDLVNIRMESTVIDKYSRRKDNKLSGNVPIGTFIDHLLTAMRDGHDVVLDEGDNSHLANNKTAQSIKAFMLKNLSDKQVRYDYGNLGIEKFTEKYELRCEITDLERLNNINPPEPVNDPQKQPQRQSQPLKPTLRNDDYDLGM